MTMLDTFKQLSNHIYLDGALRKGAGSKCRESIDPATEEVNGELAFATVAEVDEAVHEGCGEDLQEEVAPSP